MSGGCRNVPFAFSHTACPSHWLALNSEEHIFYFKLFCGANETLSPQLRHHDERHQQQWQIEAATAAATITVCVLYTYVVVRLCNRGGGVCVYGRAFSGEGSGDR